MVKLIDGRNGGKIQICEKGETANPYGRPRKWVSKLKNVGYKTVEVHETLENILGMLENELNQIHKKKGATVLELAVAAAVKKAIAKGDLTQIETLMNRVFGKPTQTVTIESKNATDTVAHLADDERAKLLELAAQRLRERSASAGNAKHSAGKSKT